MDEEVADIGNRDHEENFKTESAKQDDNDDEDLAALGSLLVGFNWSNDTVESAAKVILNPESDQNAILEAVLDIKKLLCTTRDAVYPAAQEVIDSGILECLVKLVARKDSSRSVRLQCAFCLTNIAAGTDEQTAHVVRSGSIPPLVELLESYDLQLRRQALFCIANIAGSTPEFRRILVNTPNYLKSITEILKDCREDRIEELVCWNLRNLLVLEGVDVSEMELAINVFANRLRSALPIQMIMYKFVTQGVATLHVVCANNPHWLSCLLSEDYDFSMSSFNFIDGSPQILRFIIESFVVIANTEFGRKTLYSLDIVLPILYVAKFATHPIVRNYALDTLLALTNNLTPAEKDKCIAAGMTVGLAELIADGFVYGPSQRETALSCLYNIISTYESHETRPAFLPSVTTRNAYSQVARLYKMHMSSHLSESTSAFQEKLEQSLVPIVEICYRTFMQYDGAETPLIRKLSAQTVITLLLKADQNIITQLISREFVNTVVNMICYANQLYYIKPTNESRDLCKKNSHFFWFDGLSLICNLLKIGDFIGKGNFNLVADYMDFFDAFNKIKESARYLPAEHIALDEFRECLILFGR